MTSRPLFAILCKLGSILAFLGMASLIKVTADTVPPGEAVFFRSFFAIPVIVGWLWFRQELATEFKTDNPMGHFWRGLVGTTAMGLYFTGLGLLPLPEVTAIGYAAPLFIVIFAAMFLGEQVRLFRLTAVGMGMVGIMIVLSPRLSVGIVDVDPSMALGAMAVFGGAVFAALAQVFIRKLTMSESTSTIVFWFSVTASLLSLITLYWGWVVPTPTEAALLIGSGLLGGVGQILLTSGYRFGDASLVAPFEYASMIFALIIGYVAFDEIPTMTTVWGALIIIAAGVLIIWRERQLGLERAKQRRANTP